VLGDAEARLLLFVVTDQDALIGVGPLEPVRFFGCGDLAKARPRLEVRAIDVYLYLVPALGVLEDLDQDRRGADGVDPQGLFAE
jgi:hypothetical protein